MDNYLTQKQLRESLETGTDLTGIWCKGELFVNTPEGKTVFNRVIGWEDAVEFCEDLGLDLREE